MYVIKRLDQGGGYVTRHNSNKSYTKGSIHLIRVFKTKEEANRNCCHGNEIVIPLTDIIT
jgi:hypothetical protein